MPKISQEELERERLTAAIDALRTQMHERLLEHPPEGPTHMLEIFKREKSGFAMSDAWRLAREKTLAERGVAKAATDAMFKNSSIAKSLNDAISDILDAMIVVRTAQRMPLFTNTARVRLVKLLSAETVSSYTNYFAQLSEPGVPTCKTFHEVFYPEIWVDYQVLVNALQFLITDCRERVELNRLADDARAKWASLGLILEGPNGREYAVHANDAVALIDGMMEQDRADRAAILLRKMPLGKPLPPENKRKAYSDAAKKYCLRLWEVSKNNPGELSSLAKGRNIDLDLQGRKVRYEDVYSVHTRDFEAHNFDIESAKEFEHVVRAAQTQIRRAHAEKK